MALAVVAIGARGASAQGDDDSVVVAPVTPFVAAPVVSGPVCVEVAAIADARAVAFAQCAGGDMA
ncbi:MAG: hypothetical protein IIC21_09790 [Chloroflexi bacterium]|nr:hypothetical protein [Chloroflexota bacterium]